jgi:hypothetical protein
VHTFDARDFSLGKTLQQVHPTNPTLPRLLDLREEPLDELIGIRITDVPVRMDISHKERVYIFRTGPSSIFGDAFERKEWLRHDEA